MPEQHARLSASGSHRWATCAPSLRLEKDLPRTSNRFADEGTAAHALGAWALENNAHPKDYPEPTIDVDGHPWPIAPMVEPVAKYVEMVREMAVGGTLLVEQKVSYASWIGVEDSYGTSDSVILFDDRIVIVDLKFGMGVQVYAEKNEQLMLYALGALYEYEMLGDFRWVTVAICQPRIGHFDQWTVSVTDLKTFALNMKAAALRAMKVFNAVEDPQLADYTPSDKGCQWCGAKATCPALRANVEEETRDLFADLVEAAPVAGQTTAVATIPAEIPPDRLAQAMSLVDRIEGWCKAVRAEAERRLLVGQPVPGFKLVQGRKGPRAWSSEDEAEKALKRLRLRSDEMYDWKPISPTSAEKLLKERFPAKWAKLQSLICQTDGKPSVAPESDKRPAISASSVNESFAALASGEDLV